MQPDLSKPFDRVQFYQPHPTGLHLVHEWNPGLTACKRCICEPKQLKANKDRDQNPNKRPERKQHRVL